MTGNVPAGNISLSAAILFAGALPTKALRIFNILNCCCISPGTFFRHQRQYLQPTISAAWKSEQLALVTKLRNQKKKLALSGDGRADSPGHSAKYGSYTVIEMSCNKVLDYKLVQVCPDVYLVITKPVNNYYNTFVQSNEVGGSYYMEKEGLLRVLKFLQQEKLTIEVLVTDRHRQINKWLRETYPSITHYYDVWHVAKGEELVIVNLPCILFLMVMVTTGFRKKLEAAAKQKECKIIGNWQKSIINHLYWCVASTNDGDEETILAKWLSLDNHVHNKHTHSDKKFPKCTHGDLTSSDRNKKWFNRRKFQFCACVVLTSIINNMRYVLYVSLRFKAE